MDVNGLKAELENCVTAQLAYFKAYDTIPKKDGHPVLVEGDAVTKNYRKACRELWSARYHLQGYYWKQGPQDPDHTNELHQDFRTLKSFAWPVTQYGSEYATEKYLLEQYEKHRHEPGGEERYTSQKAIVTKAWKTLMERLHKVMAHMETWFNNSDRPKQWEIWSSHALPFVNHMQERHQVAGLHNLENCKFALQHVRGCLNDHDVRRAFRFRTSYRADQRVETAHSRALEG